MRIFFFAIIGLFVFSSCQIFGGKRVNGNGNVVTRDKTVGQFNSIEVSGAVAVHIRQDANPSVRVETDENLFEYLEIDVRGNTLVIKTKSGFNLRPSKEVTVYASAAAFRDIDVSGACKIISDNVITGNEELRIHASGATSLNMQVNLPRLSTEISGSGDAVLRGTAKDFSGSISGSGSIKGFDLVTDNTMLDLSGAADAEVTANQKLDVEVSGSGDVQYKGNASVNQRISGAGSVKKAG